LVRIARLAVIGALIAVLALAVSACGSSDDESAQAAPTTTAQSPPVTTAPPASGGGEEDGVRGSGGATAAGPPAVGDPVPDLVGTSLDGEQIALSDFRGKKVIVNLWSSW
jgi:hypothetical protein